ncbi:MBL fold metallo-hydrolase RNA specificity domain-containing protein [Ekhidna sp.]
MNIRIKFLGAAKTVTGSKYLLDIDNLRLLVDCGLFQGVRDLRERNWNEFPIDPKTINAVVLTHAHIDHSGYLPRLVRQGFSGPIYCTEATADLLEVMLLDAAKLQEEEAEWAHKKGYSRHSSPQPLFTIEDAKKALSMLQGHPYEKSVHLNSKVEIVFSDAGHILGSSIVSMQIAGNEQMKKIIFSGDLGPANHPVLHPSKKLQEADIILVESTYGNREVKTENPILLFQEIINETLQNDGCLLIPSFAVGRTQAILYYLKQLLEQGLIPNVPVYIDSPMAISATALYRKHHEYHKLKKADSPSIFDYKNFHYLQPQDASVALNNVTKNAIIISASGMCAGGRILHHLYHRLPRENDTVLFVGYQAEGTRGRKILEGDEFVSIFGQHVPIKCNIRKLNGFSAHGDKTEILDWLRHFTNPPKRTFIVHGEAESSYQLARSIRKMEWKNVIVPEYLESFQLFEHI